MSDDVNRLVDILDYTAYTLNARCRKQLNRAGAYSATWMTWGTGIIYLTIPPVPGLPFTREDVALLRESGWRKVPEPDSGGRNTWVIHSKGPEEEYDAHVKNEREQSG